MNATTSSRIGIFARSKIVEKLLPAPIRLPTCSVMGPVTATPTITMTSSRISTSVVPICTGLSFHTGRPSSTS